MTFGKYLKRLSYIRMPARSIGLGAVFCRRFGPFSCPFPLKSPYRSFARQPCCIAGTIDSFSYGKKVFSYAKYFHCSCHATWLPCKTSIYLSLKKRVDLGTLEVQSAILVLGPQCQQRFSLLLFQLCHYANQVWQGWSLQVILR